MITAPSYGAYHGAMRQRLAVLVVMFVALAAGGCGDGEPPAWLQDTDGPADELVYDDTLRVPDESEFDESVDEPRADLSLDDGSTVWVWIDPRDATRIVVQASDPGDDGSWTAPQVIHRTGGECLEVRADTDGTIVAVGAECYALANDSAAGQAPSESVAAVTEDLQDWDKRDVGESTPEPEVEDGVVEFVDNVFGDGDTILTWTAEDGFERPGS